MYRFLALITYAVSHFFLNDTATTEIYTLSLHDALPIYDALPQLLHDLVLLLIELRLGILGLAAQGLGVLIDFTHELLLGFLAHGVGALAQLVLQLRDSALFLLQVALFGRKSAGQVGGRLLPILGADDAVLEGDDPDLGLKRGLRRGLRRSLRRRPGLGLGQHGRPQSDGG